ncbi:MAG: ROK family protein [Kiritimatiellia bacterium]
MKELLLKLTPAFTPDPELDPTFLPAALFNRAYQTMVDGETGSRPIELATVRRDGCCFRHCARILPEEPRYRKLTRRYVERLVKFLLWQKGGSTLYLSGCPELAGWLQSVYSPEGERAFDSDIVGVKIFGQALTVKAVAREELPRPHDPASALGGHTEGCRIGFDLGGSDRKCAAVIDGKVIFSEEIPWDPYFQSDPRYHWEGIQDSLTRAAAHLPRVDAVGGSAAGVYVNNEVRVASLFRGVGEADFEKQVRRIFPELKQEWGGVPFEVVNDGEVTALAGHLSLRDGSVLGISMGTSLAAGYCDDRGRITSWINELAFAPVDLHEDAPVDEWSGDRGCGVQCFSQQAVSRLALAAGYVFPEKTGFAEKLIQVQEDMNRHDPRARSIFNTIGIYFGYALAHYADFYDLRNIVILGRVTSGEGGELILTKAREVLDVEFPGLSETLRLSTPDEKMKRHGQAVAAASLPALNPTP